MSDIRIGNTMPLPFKYVDGVWPVSCRQGSQDPLGDDLEDDVGRRKRLAPEHEPLAIGVPGPEQH
jgi:hypothetical protein